jgi:hypothetical protein
MHPEGYFFDRKYRALQSTMATTGTTAVIGFTTEHYKSLQQKSGFADAG